MVASSVVLTVVVLNYHHRTADIHEMPPWVIYASSTTTYNSSLFHPAPSSPAPFLKCHNVDLSSFKYLRHDYRPNCKLSLPLPATIPESFLSHYLKDP